MKGIYKALALTLIGCSALLPFCASAQQYPVKPIVWVVPFPPGALSDYVARQVAPRMSKELGQPIVIENVSGAGGGVAANRVLAAPADGYTVLLATPSEVILTPMVNTSIKHQPKDFSLISPFSNNPLTLIAKKGLPPGTTREFVEYVRSKPPGSVSYGSVGVGSLYHLAMEDFAARVGIKMLHVPYKGGAPLLQDIGVGTLDAALLPLFTPAYAAYESANKLKLLAISAPARAEVAKALPTINESLLVKDFNVGVWTGLFMKAGTSQAVVSRLHAALETSMRDPAVRNALAATGTEALNTIPISDTSSFMSSEMARYKSFVERVGVKIE